jgi:hypothetical protein
MCIIATSADAVRLMCEECGSHRVIEKRRLSPAALCSTCDEIRVVLDRRRRDLGREPERRVIQASV